jgi:hypothetical protein
MSRTCVRLLALTLVVLAAPVGLSVGLLAQDNSKAATASGAEEEKKERDARRECAVKICATLHNRKPASGQVACDVRKTWPKEILTKIMSRGKLTWPWGSARCMGEIRLDRATLVRAMSEPEIEAQFERHDIRCELEGEKEKYDIKLQIHPKVTFQQGKAVKASLNWGKIEAPTLTKSALWSVTAVDNQFGVLQSTVIDDINEFIQVKCTEVKEEWQGK